MKERRENRREEEYLQARSEKSDDENLKIGDKKSMNEGLPERMNEGLPVGEKKEEEQAFTDGGKSEDLSEGKSEDLSGEKSEDPSGKEDRKKKKKAEKSEKRKQSKDRKKGKKKGSGAFSTVLLVIILFTGIGVMLYPSVTSLMSSREQAKAVIAYSSSVSALSEEEIAELLEGAVDYNKKLSQIGSATTLNIPELVGNYEDTLDVSGTGIMGYITIEKINVELPIYHGTSSGVLQIGVGHLEGSSLPVGGESTHCVLTGHRGLPTATLFTHLDEMEIGDTFTLTVLGEVLTYEVDQILTVLPSELEALYVESGEDYCTLMTCAPYGINTHRLLVRGKRIETAEEETATLIVVAEARRIDPLVVAPLVAAPMLFLLIIWLLICGIRKARRSKRKYSVTE